MSMVAAATVCGTRTTLPHCLWLRSDPDHHKRRPRRVRDGWRRLRLSIQRVQVKSRDRRHGRFRSHNLHGTYQDPGTGFGSDENERDAWAIGARIGYLVTPSLLTYINGGYTETRFAGVNYTGLFTPVLGVTFRCLSPEAHLHRRNSSAAARNTRCGGFPACSYAFNFAPRATVPPFLPLAKRSRSRFRRSSRQGRTDDFNGTRLSIRLDWAADFCAGAWFGAQGSRHPAASRCQLDRVLCRWRGRLWDVESGRVGNSVGLPSLFNDHQWRPRLVRHGGRRLRLSIQSVQQLELGGRPLRRLRSHEQSRRI